MIKISAQDYIMPLPFFPVFHLCMHKTLFVVEYQPWEQNLEIMGIFTSLKKALECLDTYTKKQVKGYDMYNLYEIPANDFLWQDMSDFTLVYHNHAGRFYVDDTIKAKCEKYSHYGEHR